MVRLVRAALAALLVTVLFTDTAAAEHDVWLEGESFVAGADATAPVQAQPNCCGVQWSGGRQLWFRAARAGDRATLTMTVPHSATYVVHASLTGAPDYGILRLSVDGVPAGQPFDGYRPSVTRTEVGLGYLPLSAGTHELTLEVVGRSARSTGYFAGLDLLTLDPTGPLPNVRTEPYTTTGATVSAGEFARVYDPSAGEGEQWYYNDHTMIQNQATGTWHLFGITHTEPAAPLDEKNFGHATAPSPRGPWTKRPFALTADPAAGESHIWAPHVIHHDGRYYMFYSTGAPEHTSYRMHLATSTDLTTWTRSPANPLFVDGYDARDPMVIRHNDQWVMYYTATGSSSGGNHQVAYRTSTDLLRWSAKRIAFEHPRSGTHGGPTESPFVFHRDGWWYLTVCCDSGYEDTRVYRSRTPLSFSIHDPAGRIPAHATEVVTEPDGTTWATSAGWGKGGVHLAPLRLTDGVVARGHRITTPYLDADVRHWPTTEIRALGVDTSGAGQDYQPVLDASARSTAPYLAVGGWGPTDRTGPAARVVVSPDSSRIGLLGIPMGNEPVTADWTIGFNSDRIDTDLSWRVTGTTTAPVWETALGLDTDQAMVGNNQRLDLDSDLAGFPRWVIASKSGLTLAGAYRNGSAWAEDNQWYQRRHGLISAQSLWDAGGRSWPPGSYPGGRWRFGVSGSIADTDLGDVLHTEVNELTDTFANPVRPNAADPAMVWHDGYYYLTYTAVDRISVVRARSVTDLATTAPTTVWLASQTPGGYTSQIWAPEPHFLDGRWYLYYTAQRGSDISTHQMFVLESAGTDPLGPYTFKAKLATPDFFSIDGTVLTVNGQRYFVHGGVPRGGLTQNLYIAPMSNPWTLAAAPTVLSRPTAAWEQLGDSETNEGPHPLYHDGRVFLTFSASQCATPNYSLGLLTYTGGDPLAPGSWRKSAGPVFAKSPAVGVYGPGHNGIFTSPDGTETWLVYHATPDPAGNCASNRSTRIQKIGWHPDGTPNFGVPAAPGAPLPVPSGDPG